jgi:IS30 family transposase
MIREEISRGLALGKGMSEIAKMLGRDRSTIWREIKTNSGKTDYRAFSASKRAQAGAGTRRKGKES